MPQPSYVIQPLTKEYIDVTLQLCDASMGNGYLSKDFLCSCLNNPKVFFYILLNPADNDVIGYSYNEVYNASEFWRQVKPFFPSEQHFQLPDGVCCKVATLGIKMDYRGQALAKTLLDYVMDSISRSTHIDFFVGTAWKQDDYVPIASTLDKIGFVPICILHRPWHDVAACCSYCKKKRCICDAALYIKSC
ncbi:hypothetical protein FACS1894201_07590 [Bacteroidia bacterium]|nr:hypothetical protein FACS1894201_07590 [Bacteroidia bacterium]